MKKFKNPKIVYTVNIKQPNLNYFYIEVLVQVKADTLIFNLPTWTPGSYLVRDYSTHLHNFCVKNVVNDNDIDFESIDHSSWKIYSKNKFFKITYRIYSFEQSVRTNFLDTEYGFLNPTSSFIYPQNINNLKIFVNLETNGYFKNIYTTLSREKSSYKANNFDDLFDSPIQFSNRSSVKYFSHGCTHEVLFEADILEDSKKEIIRDLKKITDYQINLMKFIPNDYYLFIIHSCKNGYSGLEHSKCSVNLFDFTNLSSKSDLIKLLTLLTHEYFHLWNIKRIRPIELGPFNYQIPNYTNQLWIAEGITSFYDNYIMLMSNLISKDNYLSEISYDINKLYNSEGELNMSLENSSFTAWNKFYKQNANSHNTGISYYIKGSILTLCMYIYILKNSKLNFTDILHQLYSTFYLKKKRGFSKKEFFDTCRKVTGLNLLEEFNIYLTEPIRIPVDNYLREIGVIRNEVISRVDLGFEIEDEGNYVYISKIYPNQSINNSDINLNDELISINDFRINYNNYFKILERFKKYNKVELILSRRGKIIRRTLDVSSKRTYNLVFDNNITSEVKITKEKFFGKE